MRRAEGDLVLELLSDGAEHSTRELQEAGGGLRVPSRVDELRVTLADARDEDAIPPAHADGQLVFDDRAMRRQEAA